MPEITIETPDGRFGAYLAKPASAGGPGIVLIQELKDDGNLFCVVLNQ